MIDRDKVIKGLERCTSGRDDSCTGCPYSNCDASLDFPMGGECVDATQKDALALLKADQAYLMWLAHALRMIADDTNLYKITESTARKPIDEMRDIALRGMPEEHYDRDCRDCVEWETCPVGKGAHERGASIGYSAGECPDFMRLTVDDEK